MAHDEVLQNGLELQRKPGEAPYMLFEDLQAERNVLDQLAPCRVGETNTRQFQRFDLPKVVKNSPSDEPIQVEAGIVGEVLGIDRKSTRLNSSHLVISYAVF